MDVMEKRGRITCLEDMGDEPLFRLSALVCVDWSIICCLKRLNSCFVAMSFNIFRRECFGSVDGNGDTIVDKEKE